MLQLLNRFVDICLLRRGPQHLPTALTFTVLCLGLYTVLVAAAEAWFGTPANAIPWAAVTLTLTLVVIPTLLHLRGVPERTRQTLSALAGCGILFLVVQLPMAAAIPGENETAGSLLPFIFLAWLVTFFWGFAVEGHIFRHALSLSYPAGVLLSVLLFALSQALYWLLFRSP